MTNRYLTKISGLPSLSQVKTVAEKAGGDYGKKLGVGFRAINNTLGHVGKSPLVGHVSSFSGGMQVSGISKAFAKNKVL